MIKRYALLVAVVLGGIGLAALTLRAQAGMFYPVQLLDFNPVLPLENPDPLQSQPRYVSGFGQDDEFTVFFEDRNDNGRIYFVTTTSGPTGFPITPTATNVTDTHFLVKDWPVTVEGTTYAYRAWASVGNNPDHHFYVSNNLTDWTLISTFTITNKPPITDSVFGHVYYGFHDVIQINGTYYAFAETNNARTVLVSSTTGTDDWFAFASLGSYANSPAFGPLQLPEGVGSGWTARGSFFDLGDDRGYGKIYADPRDSQFYLAVNTAAKSSLPPAELEAAFINPENWTWHDGSTGPASNPILTENLVHDLRESWLVPTSDPSQGWLVIYDGDYGAERGGKSLGYAYLLPPPLPAEYDFGDALGFPTTLAENGARHKLVSGFFMGREIDAETDGQPDAAATGDDLANVDDEDGVTFIVSPRQCETATVQITVPRAGKLDAWMDFNGDGDWDDAGEQIFASQDLALYDNRLDFAVPCDASLTPVFARFRLSSAGGLSYDGPADDGEVEDYLVTIAQRERQIFLPLVIR
jgi:hypothetical protein